MTVALIFIVAFSVVGAFNSDEFLKKYCEKNKFYESFHTKVDLYCLNVKFSPEELREIQSEDFVLANEKRIIFEGGDLDVVNINFLKKFPLTVEILFSKTLLKLTTQNEVVDSNLPLESIYISESKVFGNNNVNLFNSLPNLKHLSLTLNNMEEKTLTKQFLGNSSHLNYVQIFGPIFEKIDDDAFGDLPNIETLNLSFLNLTSLPRSIKNLKRLTWINLSRNELTEFPKEVLLSSLEDINLSSNKIDHISKEDFKNFPNLTTLFLGNNGIENIEIDTFNDLQKLEELALDGNKLSNVSKAHFEKLLNLKRVNLDRNFINVETSDLKGSGVFELNDQKIV
ncbi:Tl.2 family protein [Megaselia abdita]